MEVWAAILIVVVELLFSGTLLARLAPVGAGPELEPQVAGGCSLPVVGNAGQVSIACPGIEGKALQYLQNQLADILRQQRHGLGDPGRSIGSLAERIEDLREQADTWSQHYRQLSVRLDDSPPGRQARELIAQGEFDPVEAILPQLAGHDDQAAAATEFSLGDLAALRFDPAGALAHYQAAFDAAPDNPLYAAGYARAAYRGHDHAGAERGLVAALRGYRDLAAGDPGAYRPALALTLNNLGLVYHDTGRPAEAGRAYAEALAICRDLAAEKPEAYARLIESLTAKQAELPLPP